MIYYNIFFLFSTYFFWNYILDSKPGQCACTSESRLRECRRYFAFLWSLLFFHVSQSWNLNQHRLTCQKTNIIKKVSIKKDWTYWQREIQCLQCQLCRLGIFSQMKCQKSQSYENQVCMYIKITKRVKRNKINQISKKCWTYWQRELQFLQCQLCRLG